MGINLTDVLEAVDCPICHRSSFEIVIPAAYPATMSQEDLLRMYSSSSDQPLLDQMVRCRTCGLHYLNPRIRSEIVLQSYRDAQDETHWDQASVRVESFRKSLLAVVKHLRITPSSATRILDIGSAGGYFLKAAKDLGFSVTGVEPSAWLCATGRQQFGVDLRTGTLESCGFAPGSFDLVSLWDVIEHVPKPDLLLDQIQPLLAPGGHLVISTPDYGSLAARLLGKKWPFLLNIHLFYFTHDTIQRLLKSHGFTLLFSHPYFQTLEAGYALQRAITILPWLKPFQNILRWLRLDHQPLRYHVGQTLVVAKKD